MATWPLSLLLPQLVQSGSTIMKLNCLLKLGDNILSQPSFSNLVPKHSITGCQDNLFLSHTTS